MLNASITIADILESLSATSSPLPNSKENKEEAEGEGEGGGEGEGDGSEHEGSFSVSSAIALVALSVDGTVLAPRQPLLTLALPYCLVAPSAQPTLTAAQQGPVALWLDVVHKTHCLFHRSLRSRSVEQWDEVEETLKELSASHKRSALQRRNSKKTVASNSVQSKAEAQKAADNRGLVINIKRSWHAAHAHDHSMRLKFKADDSGVLAGTCDALLALAVHATGVDRELQLTLIMTYDVMCSSDALFDKLKALFQAASASQLRLNVLELMKMWLSKRQWQFSSNERLEERFLSWTAALAHNAVDARSLKTFQLFVESQVGLVDGSDMI